MKTEESSVLDRSDYFIGVGLVFLTVGLCFIHWPTALVVCGALLIGFGLLRALR